MSRLRGSATEPLDTIENIDDPRNALALWMDLHKHLGTLGIAFLQVFPTTNRSQPLA